MRIATLITAVTVMALLAAGCGQNAEPEPTADLAEVIAEAIAKHQATQQMSPAGQPSNGQQQTEQASVAKSGATQNGADGSVIANIAARRKAETAFQLSGADYANALESMPAAVMECAAQNGQQLTLASSDAEWAQATADNIECIQDALSQ